MYKPWAKGVPAPPASSSSASLETDLIIVQMDAHSQCQAALLTLDDVQLALLGRFGSVITAEGIGEELRAHIHPTEITAIESSLPMATAYRTLEQIQLAAETAQLTGVMSNALINGSRFILEEYLTEVHSIKGAVDLLKLQMRFDRVLRELSYFFTGPQNTQEQLSHLSRITQHALLPEDFRCSVASSIHLGYLTLVAHWIAHGTLLHGIDEFFVRDPAQSARQEEYSLKRTRLMESRLPSVDYDAKEIFEASRLTRTPLDIPFSLNGANSFLRSNQHIASLLAVNGESFPLLDIGSDRDLLSIHVELVDELIPPGWPRDLADLILRAGQARRALSRDGPNSSLHHSTDRTHSLFSDREFAASVYADLISPALLDTTGSLRLSTLASVVDRARVSWSRLLWESVLDECCLFDHLETIQALFLCRRGDLWLAFAEELETKVFDSPEIMLTRSDTATAFRNAMEAVQVFSRIESSKQLSSKGINKHLLNETPETHLGSVSDHQHDSLSTSSNPISPAPPLQMAPPSSQSLYDSAKVLFREPQSPTPKHLITMQHAGAWILKLLRGVTPRFPLPAAMHRVVTRPTQRQYVLLFQLHLSLRFALRGLTSVRTMCGRLSRTRRQRKLGASVTFLCHQLHFVLDSLLSYIHRDVEDTLFYQFDAKLREAQSVEAAREAHDKFIQGVTRGLFLETNQSVIRTIGKLLIIALGFRCIVMRPSNQRLIQRSSLTEATEKTHENALASILQNDLVQMEHATCEYVSQMLTELQSVKPTSLQAASENISDQFAETAVSRLTEQHPGLQWGTKLNFNGWWSTNRASSPCKDGSSDNQSVLRSSTRLRASRQARRSIETSSISSQQTSSRVPTVASVGRLSTPLSFRSPAPETRFATPPTQSPVRSRLSEDERSIPLRRSPGYRERFEEIDHQRNRKSRRSQSPRFTLGK